MIVRPAKPEDAGAIAHIWNPMIRASATTFNSTEKTEADVAQMLRLRREAGQGTWVLEIDGATEGFATYAQFRAGIGYAHSMEHTIVLAPNARGSGAGRALMEMLESHARAAGAHSMMAGVSGENLTAQAFHKAIGYRHVAMIPQVGRKFGRWMDLVLMQKFL